MTPLPRTRLSRTAMIEILQDSPLWQQQPQAEETLRQAVAEAAAAISTQEAELAIVLTDDSRIQILNWEWRGIDKPTNVLSFPAKEQPRAGFPPLLGDIVIAYETVEREALAHGVPLVHHLTHLTVHGFLHLQGYDHEMDEDADVMERLERQILARLGIPDPYAARDSGRD